jgi:ParB family chromosome partitioning protein
MTTKAWNTARVMGVQTLPIDELTPNPHNPRMLFDKQPMAVLAASIRRVGILVPLTVYRDERRKKFVILDGQRRWMCAQTVGLPEIPVNEVAEPSLVQNIVTMFQIHKLREDWELMPTALKVELLIKELNERNDARLAELTGLDEAVVVRCKKLLSFDKQFQDRMLDPDPDKRVKADFFIELHAVVKDREVKKFEWFHEKPFVVQMLEKYEHPDKPIKAVTDFRIIKQHVSNARRANVLPKLSVRLKRFAENVSAQIQTLDIPDASRGAEAKALTKKINDVQELIADIDVEEFYGEEDLWAAIGRVADVAQAKLKTANKRR